LALKIGDRRKRRMQSRRPDIYEKSELEGRTVAMSIWIDENTVNIRVSEKGKEGKWKQLLSKNLWKSGLK
jgi:hypothetical protein